MTLIERTLLNVNILNLGIIKLKIFRKIGIAYNANIYKGFFLSFP